MTSLICSLVCSLTPGSWIMIEKSPAARIDISFMPSVSRRRERSSTVGLVVWSVLRVVHAERDLVVLDARHDAVDPARRDHVVVLLQAREQLLALGLLLLLRPPDQEVHDHEEEPEHDERRGHAGVRRGRRPVREE